MDLGDYVEVKDRLAQALKAFPELRVIEEPATTMSIGDRLFLVCRVLVHRDHLDPMPVVASAWEPLPGRTPYTKDSELMVGFTSALGRALGYMGFGISRSLASANEVKNRAPESPRIDANALGGTEGAPKWNADNAATEKQKRAIFVISKKHGVPMPDVDAMTVADAGAWIEQMDQRQ
jgi:hypothetical protein